MAFVPSLPVVSSTTRATSQSLRPAPAFAPQAAASRALSTPRMGYGDYSYLTDKTKGHVQQYYVDKFRVQSDFTKGSPATDADAVLGRTKKGAVVVPIEGIPQEFDAALPPRDLSVAPDPRIAESEGMVYPWDPDYQDPKFAASTYADTSDSEVADWAFASFRSSVSSARGSALSQQDFGAVARVNRIMAGVTENELCSLDGQLDVEYARLQKLGWLPTLSPTGVPQTEIPGTPYLPAVGALDFIDKPGTSIAFWKSDVSDTTPMYKRPSGSNTPDLPYNVSPSIEEMQEAQDARGLLPPGSDN